MSEPTATLLNAFKIEHEGVLRHVACFIEPELAQRVGIDSRAIVGEFTPDDEGGFDGEDFEANPEFAKVFADYMNDVAILNPDVIREATAHPGGALFLVDPRYDTEEGNEPAQVDLLGRFSVDDSGAIVPGSFRYNPLHRWFVPERGASGALSDRSFYDWLHPEAGPPGTI
ncbi:hypothetical protein ACYOEI_28460 [Singulisphaera rosea]